MQPKYCLKYHVDAEEKIHFFSGMDGSLFVPSDEKFYSNEQYCVDYFYFLDDDNVAEIKVTCLRRLIRFNKSKILSILMPKYKTK